MQEGLGSAVLHLLVVSFRSNDIWIPFESTYDLCIGKAAGLALCLFVVRFEGKFTRNDDEQNIIETDMLMKIFAKNFFFMLEYVNCNLCLISAAIL